MNDNLNTTEVALQENLKKLLSLLRNQPIDPNDKPAVWREYGPVKTFWVIFMGLFIPAYLLVMIPALRLAGKQDVTKLLYWEVDSGIYILIVLFCAIGVGAITLLLTLDYTQKVFHSHHQHEAVAALGDWRWAIGFVIQDLEDDLYNFEVLKELSEDDLKAIKLSHAGPDTVAKLEAAFRNHVLTLKTAENFTRCVYDNVGYEGDVAAFRDSVLTLLDQIAPRDNRPDR